MSDIKLFALDGAKELLGSAANLKVLEKAKPVVKQSYEQD